MTQRMPWYGLSIEDHGDCRRFENKLNAPHSDGPSLRGAIFQLKKNMSNPTAPKQSFFIAKGDCFVALKSH